MEETGRVDTTSSVPPEQKLLDRVLERQQNQFAETMKLFASELHGLREELATARRQQMIVAVILVILLGARDFVMTEFKGMGFQIVTSTSPQVSP